MENNLVCYLNKNEKMREFEIDIPQPCNQKWEEMKTCGLNRYCLKCEKEIIDFSFYSDRALVKVIEENKGRICGRFTKEQLNRELLVSQKRKSFFANFSASWIGLWLFLSAPFQSVKAQVKTEIFPELKTKIIVTNRFFISGVVVDEDNQPVPDIKVKIFELGQGTFTDSNGKFKIVFEDNSFGNYSIEFTGTGLSEVNGYSFYDTLKISNISPNTSDIRVVLTRDKLLEDTMIIGIIVTEPKFDIFEPKTWTPRIHKRKRRNR